MSGSFSDIADTRAFEVAQQETLDAVGRVARAVEALSATVHGLPVEGEFASAWQAAVAKFDAGSQATKRNCVQLADAVRSHGRSTDAANVSAAQAFHDLARKAGDAPGLV